MHCISYVAADAIQIRFSDTEIDTCAAEVATLTHFLTTHFQRECVDVVPAYDSVTAFVDFPATYPQMLAPHIEAFLQSKALEQATVKPSKPVILPCCYDPEFALDLESLSKHSNLTAEDVIRIHSSKTYRVYAIGFSPGFPYLGFVDERIACPRLNTPRIQIPEGSVGIAEKQTGIYPTGSPGGWNIIGSCPRPLFKPQHRDAETLCTLRVGDQVTFQPITKHEYLALKREALSA